MQNTNYLSLQKITVLERRQKRRVIVGAILSCLFGFGICGGIFSYTEDLRKSLPVYIVLMIPSALLLFSGLRLGKRNGMARRYETIFSGDHDGFVTAEELARQTGLPQDKIMKELEALFREGYFQNCTLQRGTPCGVSLNNAGIDERGAGFAYIKCAECGATTKIRAGTRSACSYCGSPIADDQFKKN